MNWISLRDLYVLQDNLRHWDDMISMVEFVRNGGFWTKEYLEKYATLHKLPRVSPIISISIFEDGMKFVHDGHHRTVATWLAGRDCLREDEYTLTNWKYDEYLEIAPENNWYTPFDPRIHVRTADFAQFKKEARDRFKNNPEEALAWLNENMHEFRTDRKISTVPNLSEHWSKNI